ncbi:MAG: hypothetical protein ACI3T9_02215 [Romboutsia timonensis]
MSEVNIKLKLAIANYILDNKCSYGEAAKHFGRYTSWVSSHMRYFKKNDAEFYNKIKTAAEEGGKIAVKASNKNRSDVDRMLKFVNYIIENKCGYKECGAHFGVTGQCARSLCIRVDAIDKDLYEKMIETVKEANTRQIETKEKVVRFSSKNIEVCEEIANWIVSNEETYEAAAEQFSISSRTISRCMETVKLNNIVLFEEMKKANAKGKIKSASVGGRGGWCKVVGEQQLNTVTLDEIEEDAKKTMKRMLWFKQNLKTGDIVKYGSSDECSRKVAVKEKYKNFFRTDKGECLYYQNCIKIIA